MKKWPAKLLGEISILSAGDPAPQNSDDFAELGVPFVRMQDVGRFGKTLSLIQTKDHLAPEASMRLRKFPQGAILVPKSGASIRLNHRAILGIEAHVVSHLAVIIPKEIVNNRFLYYWLCTLDLSKIAHDADMPSMKTSDLEALNVPCPPYDTQERIVKLLDEADELRKLREQADKRSAELIPALFEEMFGDPETNPKGCKVVFLEEIASKITDGVHLKPNYISSGIPFISVKDITTGVLKFDECKYISQEDHERYTRRCKPEFHDILYTKVGATYGRPALIDTEKPFSIYVSVCLIKPIKELVDPVFLNAILGTPATKRQAIRSIKGIGVPDLHLNMIQKFRIPLPPLPLQREFAALVSDLRALESAQSASRKNLDALFQSMLHRAFEGKL